MSKHTEITAHPTPWQSVILICRKCSKKLEGGFGPDGDQSLTRELKRALRADGHRRTVRIIETKCLGVCPKNAVTVLPGAHPATILTIPAGTPSETVLARLPPGLAPQPPRTAAPAGGS